MRAISTKWLALFVMVSAVAALEIRQKEDEIIDLNQELLERERRQINVGGFQFPTANQNGGNRPADRQPNCQGRRRRRPECQNQNKPINCNNRRNRNKPQCQRESGTNAAVAEAFNQVQWFDQLASPNKSALQIPRLPGTPGKGQENRFFLLGQGADRPFHQCVTPKFENGHCRYLQHCILPEFANDFFTFLNYVCFIEGTYIGACCPDSRYGTTPRPTTTPPTTTTPRPATPPSDRGCGLNAKNGNRIVGGQKTDPQEWPWMAALLRDGSDQYCGGVLITNAHILTAAHCVKPFSASSITIRLGEYTFDQTDDSSHRDFKVRSIQMHEKYNTETYENDIAIISLQGQVEQFNDFIWPICLPPADNKKYAGEKATVTGWGTIYYGGPISSFLQEVTLPIWTNQKCDAAYAEQDIVDNFLCAGIDAGGQDSCQGDSGGPLQWQDPVNGRWAVIGVVSWGIKCAEPNNPGVYTRVNNYIDWIRNNAI